MTEHCPACGYQLTSARIPTDRAEVMQRLNQSLQPITRRLFRTFLVRFGQTIPLNALIDAIWPNPNNNVDNELGTIRVHLTKLRNVLDEHDVSWIIEAQYKIGYRMRERNEDERIAWEAAKASGRKDRRVANGGSRTRGRKAEAVRSQDRV